MMLGLSWLLVRGGCMAVDIPGVVVVNASSLSLLWVMVNGRQSGEVG